MLRPGVERKARTRPDAARTVNTVAPTPVSESSQPSPELAAEGSVPLTLINQLRAQAVSQRSSPRFRPGRIRTRNVAVHTQ